MTSAERQKTIALLRQKVKLYEALEKSGTIGKDDLIKYHAALKDLAKVERIESGWQSIMAFAKIYFSGSSPSDLLQDHTPSPDFHYELVDILRQNATSEWGSRTSLCAPRSHSKSTIVSNIFLCWVACYQDDINRAYWILIGDKQATAQSQLNVVRMAFEENERIIEDFGNLIDKSTALELVLKSPTTGKPATKFQAAGAGEALRGLRWGAARPNVVCDDLEGNDNVSTSEQIQKMQTYFDSTIVPLGDPQRMMILVIGTILHYQSLLAVLITKRPDWKSKSYAALVHFPDRMDLWDQWQRIYSARDEGNSPAEASEIAGQKARQFYLDHKEEMDAGAEVLWPERMPLYDLMQMRVTNPLAFATEMQNNPQDSDSCVFNKYHTYDPTEIDISELEIIGGVDPSMAETKRADPSAIITIGKSKVGIYYVLDIDVRRRSPDKIIEDILTKHAIYNYKWFSVEAVQFQAFFANELKKRSAISGDYLNIREFKSTVKKLLRISSLEPMVTNGYLRFLPSQIPILEELMYYPKVKNDDCLDVCSQVIEQDSKRGGRGVIARL